MTTKELEHKIYFTLKKMGTYLCFEVGMPNKQRGTKIKQRVDLLSYDTTGIWRFYELKVSKSDFYSKAKNTFLGHYNYYVMPKEIYKQVKKDIPSYVGCYISDDKHELCWCVKKAKKQSLDINSDKLMFAFMQALDREYSKYRKILKRKIKNGWDCYEL